MHIFDHYCILQTIEFGTRFLRKTKKNKHKQNEINLQLRPLDKYSLQFLHVPQL
jgi:hypothetical protein